MKIGEIQENIGSKLYKAILTAIYGFSILPVIIVAVTAFGSNKSLKFPPTGFTLKWYADAFRQFSQYGEPLLYSLEIAVFASVISTILGTLATYALIRYRPRYVELIQGAFTAPLTVPQIVIGLALLIFFTTARLSVGTFALIFGHVVIGIPFVVTFVSVSLNQLDDSLIWSARDLGADRYQTFRRIIIPLIKPGIFAGGAFAFITSYNNVPVSLFLIKAGQTTLPLRIFQNLQYGFTPDLAAVAVIQVAIVLFLLIAVNYVTDITELF